MENRKKRILAILSGLLGNRTLSDRYLEVLKGMAEYEVNFFYITVDDYARYPASGLTKFSSALRMMDIVKRKYQEIDPDDYDLLFINGYEIAYGLLDQVKAHPTMLALDVVPGLAHKLLIRTSKSLLMKLRSWLVSGIMTKKFAELFAEVNGFLPMSEWCGRALQQDYGIREDKITATYVPADLSIWRPDHKDPHDSVRLLFVGNDFERKGGRQLLEMYKRIIEYSFRRNAQAQSSKIFLRIVSNDPVLDTMDLPEGVELYQNIAHEEIVKIFQSSDIFVFPTLKEYLGVVATEACCVGLPVVARDVGGLREFIIDGHNGYLMPYESTEAEWVEKIQYLIDHLDERKRMGENSRKTAEEMFGMERFEKIVEDTLIKITTQAQDKRLKES